MGFGGGALIGAPLAANLICVGALPNLPQVAAAVPSGGLARAIRCCVVGRIS